MTRVLTYNVHRWVGIDRKVSYARIAEVIASTEADIVSLQETRAGKIYSGEPDQTEALAKLLNMDLHFQPTIKVFGQQYGLAVLTRLPSRRVRGETLPTVSLGAPMEKRSALWVEVNDGDDNIQIINAHLSLRSADRNLQAQTLLGDKWVNAAEQKNCVALMGDFNAHTRSRTYKMFHETLNDVQLAESVKEAKATFHSRMPLARLDHIFLNDQAHVKKAGPWITPLSKVASDHLPLVADIHVSVGKSLPVLNMAA